MILYVLRHGEAEDSSKYKDFKRPLTRNGQKQIKQLAKSIEHLNIKFDFMLTSPYIRAHQTAEIIAQKYDLAQKLIPTAHLLPEADPEQIIDEIVSTYRNINALLLVGHNPHLSRLVALLSTGGYSTSVYLDKGALCKLTTQSSLFYGKCAIMNWLLSPDEIKHIK